MNKNIAKKKNLLGISIAFVLLAIFLLFGFIALKGKNATAAEASLVVDNGQWIDEYQVDSQWSVPSAKIAVGNEELDIKECFVIYPDGVAYQKDSYNLSQIGEYTVRFIAENDSKDVVVEKTFCVYNESIIIDGGSYERRTQLEMTNSPKAGIGLTISDGGKFTYGSPLNISSADLTTPIATVYPYNYTKRLNSDGTLLESKIIIVRLTDCYDDSNYIDFEILYSANNLHKRMRAGTSKSGPFGFVKTNAVDSWWKTIEYEGQLYNLLYKPTATSMDSVGTSIGAINQLGNDAIEIYYEYDTCKVYAKTYNAQNVATTTFIADLSCADAYDIPFEGFTTGEVYLSVLGDWYVQGSMRLEIGSIYGIEGENLIKTYAYDKVAPTITLPYTNEEIGEIVVATNETVSILPCEAKDSSGVRETTVKVYYAYGTNRQTSVGIVDNTFVPKNVGTYSIVYGAYDVYGNYAEKVFKVNSKNCDYNESLFLQFANDSDVEFNSATPVDVLAGKTYALPTYTLSNANDFETQLSVYTLYKDGSVKEIDKEQNQLTFYNLGEYTLVYEYKDIFQTKVKKFLFNAKTSDESAIEETLYFPRYYIKNAKYSLDVCEVKTFKNNQINIYPPKVYANFDNQGYQEINANEFVITGSKNVAFKYVYENKVLYESMTAIPIVDVKYDKALKIKEYFLGDFQKFDSSNNIEFLSNVTEGNNTLEFINPISFSNFNLEYEIMKERSNFDSFTIKGHAYIAKFLLEYLGYQNAPACFESDMENDEIAKLQSIERDTAFARFNVGCYLEGKVEEDRLAYAREVVDNKNKSDWIRNVFQHYLEYYGRFDSLQDEIVKMTEAYLEISISH